VITQRRRSLALLALAAVGLAVGLAGPSAAIPTKCVHGLHQFQSPSGNIGCEIARRVVRCDIKSRAWTPPPKPANCDLDYGQGLAVGRHGKGSFVCAGDTALDPSAHKLRYGRSIRDARMRCVSKRTGMRCANHRTGHGFFLSRESYRRF
jgi:uncharacterized protein DUF6636